MERLVEIEDLMDFLGCSDERTITTWCKERSIPIVRMGKKKYTVRDHIDAYIQAEVDRQVQSSRVTNSDSTKGISVNQTVSSNDTSTNRMSEAAKAYLRTIKK